jgi:2-oxoglutarate ferredoxin oxidoreductase subunit delta
LALITVDKELCKGCELCVHFCPKAVIEMGDGFNSKGNRFSCFIENGTCTGCALCAKICPDVAIEVWR